MEQPLRPLTLGPAALAAGTLLLACSTSGASSEDPRFTADSVPASRRAADPPPADPSPGIGPDDADEVKSCYSESTTCSSLECSTLPSCCTLNTACCAPVAVSPIPALVDFTACDGTVESCELDLRAFGSVRVQAGMLAPDGMSADSGVVIGSPIDLRVHRVTVSATLETTACDGPCIEAAGFGFATEHVGGPLMRPIAALLASSDRRSVSFVSGDRIVASWPMTSSSERWTLALDPAGRARVFGPGIDQAFQTMPQDGASLVAYGRNDPARPESGARIGAIETSVALCDVPNAWDARETVAIAPTTIESPSIVRESAGDVIVWASRGEIFAADSDGTMWNQGRPVLTGANFHDEGGVADPELVLKDGEWNLFYTAISHNGLRSIGRAVAPVRGPFVADTTPVVTPDGSLAEEALEMPTVAQVFDGRWVLVARVRSEARTALSAFVSPDGKLFTRMEGSLATSTERAAGDASFAFDAHEIADPSLVIVNGAYHLFYAGRRGTRSSIGLMLSDDLRFWRPIEDAVLEPDAVDRIAVRAPDAVVGEDGVVHLYFIGDDGRSLRLRRTSRIAPTHMGAE